LEDDYFGLMVGGSVISESAGVNCSFLLDIELSSEQINITFAEEGPSLTSFVVEDFDNSSKLILLS